MDEQRIEDIQKRMNEKDTDTLCAIWVRNDRHEWAEEAFEAIRRVLVSRQINPPQQTQAPVNPQQPNLSPTPQAYSSQTSVFSFLKGIGAIGGVILFLFLMTTPFMIIHWFENRGRWKEEKHILQDNRAQILLDFSGTNTTKRIAAMKVLRHDDTMIPILERGLKEDGNAELALSFCNDSEDYRLLSAGIGWLQSHDFQVWKHTRTGGYVRYFVKSGQNGLNTEDANKASEAIAPQGGAQPQR